MRVVIRKQPSGAIGVIASEPGCTYLLLDQDVKGMPAPLIRLDSAGTLCYARSDKSEVDPSLVCAEFDCYNRPTTDMSKAQLSGLVRAFQVVIEAHAEQRARQSSSLNAVWDASVGRARGALEAAGIRVARTKGCE